MRQSFLDFSFEVMDSPKRALDFCLIACLKSKIPMKDLYSGAQLAFKTFPKSNCYLKSYEYKLCEKQWSILEQNCVEKSKNRVIEGFLEKPFELHKERGIKQLLLYCEENVYLVTRMHHGLGDALSFLSWLKVQLTGKTIHDEYLILKKYKKPLIPLPGKFFNNIKNIQKKDPEKSKLKKRWNFHPSTSLKPHRKFKISNQRRWTSFSFERPMGERKKNIIRQGFSYNDLLCAILFETIREFKGKKQNSSKKYGIYLPMNIRVSPYSGFGNGSSRIKIYDLYSQKSESYKTIAKVVRQQVNSCQKNGSWKIPQELGIIARIPKLLSKTLLRIYASLYFHDFGTLVFSHIEKYGPIEDLFDYFSNITIVSQLYKAYGMVLVAMTFESKTVLTFTWDDSIFYKKEIRNFFNIFLKNKEIAFKELNL